ncbi:hypothetical protein RRSWK_02352 [Rhodopirellula sp. SWK7]|nr:hypothetical protein RRSWK_02352 [Rhodopirellula sp. SWK7]
MNEPERFPRDSEYRNYSGPSKLRFSTGPKTAASLSDERRPPSGKPILKIERVAHRDATTLDISLSRLEFWMLPDIIPFAAFKRCGQNRADPNEEREWISPRK